VKDTEDGCSDGKATDATFFEQKMGAAYGNIIDVNDGILIAVGNFSPTGDAVENDVSPSVYNQYIPQPNAYSDLMFLQYSGMCASRNAPVGGLTHVFQVSVINGETADVIEEALADREPLSWATRVTFTPTPPGTQQTVDNRAFYGLLYTPNVRGIAWLLVQHKAQMGLRYIDAISVWRKLDPEKNTIVDEMYIHISPWTDTT
jgi:hypothetical protein